MIAALQEAGADWLTCRFKVMICKLLTQARRPNSANLLAH